MIIAVDFDGTLQYSRGEANTALISKLRKEQRQGNTVILWTCREGESLKKAMIFLRKNGFIPNFVNQNPPEVIKRMGNNPRKVYADVYIDDKAIFF